MNVDLDLNSLSAQVLDLASRMESNVDLELDPSGQVGKAIIEDTFGFSKDRQFAFVIRAEAAAESGEQLSATIRKIRLEDKAEEVLSISTVDPSFLTLFLKNGDHIPTSVSSENLQEVLGGSHSKRSNFKSKQILFNQAPVLLEAIEALESARMFRVLEPRQPKPVSFDLSM